MTQGEALNILKTGANVFLTGEPGSGKTFTINQYVGYLREHGIEPAITASTGIAATHIGGLTIHSWSGIGIKKNLSKYDYDNITTKEHVVKRVSRAKVLIIDEVSMLEAGTLESVDYVCRLIRHSTSAFGGLQVILVGDFFQLPPINTSSQGPVAGRQAMQEESQEVIFDEFENNRGQTRFCFRSKSWQEMNPIICYLSEQHRQEDDKFLSILNSIRRNEFELEHFEYLQSRLKAQNQQEGLPQLFSHNEDVDRINKRQLDKISGLPHLYTMETKGPNLLVETLKRGCLSPEKLELKVGAKVMFTKNNPAEGYVNGTLGEVVEFDEINRQPLVKLRNGRVVEVAQAEWVIEENNKVKARILQYPLRLAWAITIHKSQGMSLDAAVMDLSQVFEYGQGYVALSRVRSLSGIYLLGVNERAFQVHPEVLAQDMNFRTSSEEAEQVFESMDKAELQKMHDNFITASGGSVKKEKRARTTHKQKTVKGQSLVGTFELVEQGKTAQEIAEERGLSKSTIMSHFYQLLHKGNIDKEVLLRELSPAAQKSFSMIKGLFEKEGYDRLTPVYEKLSGKFGYDDLRIIREIGNK